jgi:hypothetical protein
MFRVPSPSRFALFLTAIAVLGSALSPTPAQPPAAPPPLTSADEEKSVLTETVGLLAGLQLYQTYLNIGFLADARAEGLYEASELTQLLGSAVVPLDKVDKQMEKLSKLTLSDDDKAAVARLRKINALLRIQGVELQAFWDTGVADHAKKYETARQAVWKELSNLLELEKSGDTPRPTSNTRQEAVTVWRAATIGSPLPVTAFR